MILWVTTLIVSPIVIMGLLMLFSKDSKTVEMSVPVFCFAVFFALIGYGAIGNTYPVEKFSEQVDIKYSLFKEPDRIVVVIGSHAFFYTDAKIVNHVDELEVIISKLGSKNSYGRKRFNGYDVIFVPKILLDTIEIKPDQGEDK